MTFRIPGHPVPCSCEGCREDLIPQDPKHTCMLCEQGPINDGDWDRGERFDTVACEHEWANVAGAEIGDLYRCVTMPANQIDLHAATKKFIARWTELRKIATRHRVKHQGR